MMNKLKILVAAMVVAGSASTAFAASLPQQDRDAWFVDSGRYINGQTPSEPYYGDHPQGIHGQGLIEGRNSAFVGGSMTRGSSTSRNAMVQELGN